MSVYGNTSDGNCKLARKCLLSETPINNPSSSQRSSVHKRWTASQSNFPSLFGGSERRNPWLPSNYSDGNASDIKLRDRKFLLSIYFSLHSYRLQIGMRVWNTKRPSGYHQKWSFWQCTIFFLHFVGSQILAYCTRDRGFKSPSNYYVNAYPKVEQIQVWQTCPCNSTLIALYSKPIYTE